MGLETYQCSAMTWCTVQFQSNLYADIINLDTVNLYKVVVTVRLAFFMGYE